MMKRILVLVMCLSCSNALAREGFSLSLGIGGGIWKLDSDSLNSVLSEIGRSDGQRMLETLEDGLAIRFAMAYNILGYASIEIGLTGHGWNLGGDDNLGGSGHASLVAHFHPLQLWFPERDYDASVYLGGGYSIIGGGHSNDNLDRGLDGGALECGFTGRYFFTPWYSLGADFRFTLPFYNRWVVDWDDEDYSLNSAPSALFFAILVTSTFHFQTASN